MDKWSIYVLFAYLARVSAETHEFIECARPPGEENLININLPDGKLIHVVDAFLAKTLPDSQFVCKTNEYHDKYDACTGLLVELTERVREECSFKQRCSVKLVYEEDNLSSCGSLYDGGTVYFIVNISSYLQSICGDHVQRLHAGENLTVTSTGIDLISLGYPGLWERPFSPFSCTFSIPEGSRVNVQILDFIIDDKASDGEYCITIQSTTLCTQKPWHSFDHDIQATGEHKLDVFSKDKQLSTTAVKYHIRLLGRKCANVTLKCGSDTMGSSPQHEKCQTDSVVMVLAVLLAVVFIIAVVLAVLILLSRRRHIKANVQDGRTVNRDVDTAWRAIPGGRSNADNATDSYIDGGYLTPIKSNDVIYDDIKEDYDYITIKDAQ